MSVRRFVARTAAVAIAVCTCPSGAWEINYSVDMAFGYSDNVNQVPENPSGSAILIPRLNFDFHEQGASLDARAAGQVEYRTYSSSDANNEFRGQVSALANWIIFPRRLSFDFEEYAGVEPVSVLAPNSPANTQQTNVFTLGPTFNFRIAQTLNGEADLRYTNTSASQSKEFDSNRGLAALRAVKDLSTLDKLSFSVEYQTINFTDPTGGPNYDRYDAYLRYEKKLTELDIDLLGGYTWLDFSGHPNDSGPLARAAVTWHATPSNAFTFSALRRFADASQDITIDPTLLVQSITGGGILVGSTPVDSNVYLERRVDFRWDWQNARWHTYVGPYYKKLDYVIDPTLDQKTHGAGAGVSYRPRPLWTLAFDATEETREYSTLLRRDEDLHFDLSFTDQLSRHWGARIDLIRNERNSDAPLQGFKENVVFLTLIFTR
jgi:hypothetical protein